MLKDQAITPPVLAHQYKALADDVLGLAGAQRFSVQPDFAAKAFSEGLAPVKLKKSWGFIDKTGKLVINPQFDEVGAFDPLEQIGNQVVEVVKLRTFLSRREARSEALSMVIDIVRSTFQLADSRAVTTGLMQSGAVPALVVTGTQDPTCPPAMARELAGYFGTSAILLDGIGHLPMIESPQLTATLLRGHLDGR